jgi:hypothetical protein
LILIGDYPDHRERKYRRTQSDRHQSNRYRLSDSRSIHYTQTPTQKLNTLLMASSAGRMLEIDLSKTAFDALREFRSNPGSKSGHKEFIEWYRKTYPQYYAAVF